MRPTIDVTYYLVEVQYFPPEEVTDWCISKFGPTSNITWFYRNRTFYFTKESDRTMFVLRWS